MTRCAGAGLPAVLSLTLFGMLCASCAAPSADAPAAEDSGNRSAPVAIIGWDGATWDVIRPMVARGELPHLARLLESGSHAVLRAEPPILSPVVWTTLATGFPPAEHGVVSFQLPDPSGGPHPVLASSFHRRRAPLWKMVSAGERSVGFIGWWTTWPAEPVDGYVISDHLAYNRWDAWAARPEGVGYHLTFPPELAEALAPYAVRPETLSVETLTALVPFNAEEQREMMQATSPIIFHAPSVFRFGYSTDASNQQFAKRMLDVQDQPDLFALVYILSDVAGHVFWHHYEPEAYPGPRERPDHLREAIPNIYRQLDRWTGEILERLDPRTRIFIVSDHGMHAGGVLPHPGVNPAGDHMPEGILVAAGPGIPSGADLGELRQIDFAPTVLAMLGLPVAQDMPGAVVEPLVGDEGVDRTSIASYGAGQTDFSATEVSPGDEDYKARLRSLGYIQ